MKTLSKPIAAAVAIALVLSAKTADALPQGVAQAKIDAEFEHILLAHPFLMQEGGAKFIQLPGGTNLLFAVGVTDRKKTANPAAEAIRQRRVADVKARRAVTEALHGISVVSFVQTTEKTVVKRNGKGEEVVVEDLTELLQRSETDISGWIPGLPVVGTWVLPDDDLFCLAIGRMFPPAN